MANLKNNLVTITKAKKHQEKCKALAFPGLPWHALELVFPLSAREGQGDSGQRTQPECQRLKIQGGPECQGLPEVKKGSDDL